MESRKKISQKLITILIDNHEIKDILLRAIEGTDCMPVRDDKLPSLSLRKVVAKNYIKEKTQYDEDEIMISELANFLHKGIQNSECLTFIIRFLIRLDEAPEVRNMIHNKAKFPLILHQVKEIIGVKVKEVFLLFLIFFIAFNVLQQVQISISTPVVQSLKNQTYLEDPSVEEIVEALSNGFPLSNYTRPKPGDILINNGSWSLEMLLAHYPGVLKHLTLDSNRDAFLMTKSIVIGKGAEVNIVDSQLLLESSSRKDNIPTVLISRRRHNLFELDCQFMG